MKKIICLFLCIFWVLSLVACQYPVIEAPDYPPPESNLFISLEEKNTWKENLASLLYNVQRADMQISSEIISMNLASVSVGLMDINFDNVPEVFFAYQGGSMGNVPLDIYDLESGQKLGNYNASHSDSWNNICIYVAKSNDGYILLSEGTVNDPDYQYLKILSVLNMDFDPHGNINSQNMFLKSIGEGTLYYEYNGEIVSEEIYNTKYQEFFGYYTKLESTQIIMHNWADIGFTLNEFNNLEFYAQKMADTLLNSKQEFINNKN